MENFRRQFVMALIAYAVQRDIDAESLCYKSGIDFKKLSSNVNFNISNEQKEALWKNCSVLSHDPLFGLHFGESLQLAALGVVGQIIQTSATVSDALTNACALVPLVTDMFEMKIEHTKKHFIVHLPVDEKLKASFPFTYRHTADYLMVFILHELDGLLLEKTKPSRATFPYYQSESYEYTRVFRDSTIAKDENLTIEFSAHYLSIPILSANYELQNLLLRKMNELLQKKNSLWHDRVYNYLLTNSYLNTLSIVTVANNFNLSERGLQRKLKSEGHSYLRIAEKVRKALATNYLENQSISIKDITHILGYNEESAFLRAFKRWTGATPTEYKVKSK